MRYLDHVLSPENLTDYFRAVHVPALAIFGVWTTITGRGTGALSGLFVVGGALVSVPLLERITGYSRQRAQAMVLAMLVPASAIGLVV